MTMLFSDLQTRKTPHCIRHEAFENLYVIPYVKGRLVFAEMTARAIEEGEFDYILVDMPYFLNNASCLRMAVASFPLVSSLVVKKGDKYLTIPFAPNDAACIAVSAVMLDKNMGGKTEFRCIDDSNIVSLIEHLSLPRQALKDDYYVFTEGLERYFKKPFEELKDIWAKLPESTRFYSSHRAAEVAGRLRGFLKNGKKTLFVCEYSLWQLISKSLSSKKRDENRLIIPWENLSAAFVMEDPYIFWSMGLLDDFPCAVAEFYRCIQSGGINNFDKLDSLNKAVASAVSEKESKPSIRKIKAFADYLKTIMSINLCIAPHPVRHLHDAAVSCVGKAFAKKLSEAFLRYPEPTRQNVLRFLTIYKDSIVYGVGGFKIPDLQEQDFLYPGFHKPSLDASFEERFKIANIARPGLTQTETMELGRDWGGIQWETEQDYSLHKAACGHGRNIALKRLNKDNVMIKRSWGEMAEGIHWKSTLRAWAVAEDAVYIKKRRHNGKKGLRFTEYTPMAFIFEEVSGFDWMTVHDSNLSQRNMELGNRDFPFYKHEPPDSVYSVFYTIKKREMLCGGHIYRQEISSIAFLYTKDMGIKRYKGITKRHERFQCRTIPANDPELYGFSAQEIGAAWCVKYAEDAVIVVAKSGWKPSGQLMDYARKKGVELIILSLDCFSNNVIERLKVMHCTTTALKKHPELEKIVNRFIG